MGQCIPPFPNRVPAAPAGPPLPEGLAGGLDQFAREVDLDTLARTHGALQRRRQVSGALGLLRLALGYSVLGYSLRLLGAWATLTEAGSLSKTALLKRLRACRGWLGRLVVLALRRAAVELPGGEPVRLRVLDATVVCHPGSRGTDWRLHLSFDLGRAGLEQVELTDGHGAESLRRFAFRPDEIILADKAYALAPGLGALLGPGAQVVVRTGWNRLRLLDARGRPFDLVGWLRPGAGAAREVDAWLETPAGRFRLRLVAQALPPAAVEQARRRVRAQARKNHHTPDARSLYTAGFLLLLTNLPAPRWSTAQVLALYRFRWQVEVYFKRLKGVIRLGELPTQDPTLAQVYLFAKLLALILVEGAQHGVWATRPAGWGTPERPLSPGRWLRLAWEAFAAQLRGVITWAQIEQRLPQLVRYLCDEPRARPQQLAGAQALLANLSGVDLA